jgi:hypothetical protein
MTTGTDGVDGELWNLGKVTAGTYTFVNQRVNKSAPISAQVSSTGPR